MSTLANSSSPVGRDWAINLEHVAKVYQGRFGRKKVHALRGITMRVHQGEIFGLLGPNGAGKSTLVKILMTIIRASECRGVMLGRPVGDKPMLARVGYLPEHHKFPDYLTGEQVLDFYGALSLVPRNVRKPRAAELLDLVGISKWATSRVKGYSKGMRQRLGIANALMSDPDLVLLDEPTDGVDPVGRRDIREVLLRLRQQGKTVFLNSHLLSELEMVCDRVAILVQGVVSAQGTMDELTRESQRYEIEVGPLARGQSMGSDPADGESIMRAVSAIVTRADAAVQTGQPAARISGKLAHTDVAVTIDRGLIKVASDDALAIQPLIDALRSHGQTVRSVRPIRNSLEDLFMMAVTDPTTGKMLKPGAADAPLTSPS